MPQSIAIKSYLVTFVFLVILALPSVSPAQNKPANLLANHVEVNTKTQTLVAMGDVQIFYDGAVLHAQKIRYDQKTNRINIIGQFEIKRGKELNIYATDAQIDSKLETALIGSARALIQESLRIKAQKTKLEPSKVTRFENVIASTCVACDKNTTPFWELRAKRVFHSPEKKRIYFENAVLRIGSIPVLATPVFSFPEPNVTRSSGLLSPSFGSSDELGLSAKLPFYYKINQHSDATFAPFFSSRGSSIIEGEYRRRTQRGGYHIQGAFTLQDPFTTTGTSAYIKSDARFKLWEDYQLDIALHLSTENFDKNDSTQKSFIQRYNYSSQDRLRNALTLSRIKSHSYFELGAESVQSLRANEPDSDVPSVIPAIYYERHFGDQHKAGKFKLQAQFIGLQKFSGGAHYALAGKTSWQKTWYQKNGLVFSIGARADATNYRGNNNRGSSLLPSINATLRYPLKYHSGTVTHTLEPIIQFIAAPNKPFGNFNTVSTTLDGITVEFEETNLFSLNRFSGFDRTEAGVRANIGIKYQRSQSDGFNYYITVGRVLRARNLNQFSATNAAGLSKGHSDFVSALTLSYRDLFNVKSRLLFNDSLTTSKNETSATIKLGKVSTNISYVDLNVDPTNKQREITVNALYKANDKLSFIGSLRHNLVSSQPIKQSITVNYGNECAKIRFQLGRQFTKDRTANRFIGFQLELGSFGRQSTNPKFNRRCNG